MTLTCRLSNVDIHRIGLLDGGQNSSIAGIQQRTFRNFRLTDKAGNWRSNAGAVQTDTGRFDGCLSGFDARLC